MSDKNKSKTIIITLGILAGVFLVMIILLLGAFVIIRNRTIEKEAKKVAAVIEKEVELVEETEPTISTEIIEQDLSDIGELATEEYFYTGVEKYSKNLTYEDFNIPFTDSYFIYSYDGIIKAGIDFKKVKAKVDDKDKKILVTLPKATILSTELVDGSLEVFDQSSSIFNPIKVEDVDISQTDLKDKARNKALESGILDRAEENVQKMIKTFLERSLPVDDYTVEVEFRELSGGE